MRICVLGTGYVGLVAGACFSDSGNHVICVDLDEEKLNRLRKAEVPFFEPGLDEVVRRNTKSGRLTFTSNSKAAIAESKVIFVAVGTPQAADGSSNLTYLDQAIRTIGESIHQDCIVVLKSTVPVGTADRARTLLKGVKHHVEIVSNPEFLKEGAAVNDFLRPERVIIGTESEKARQIMADLYAPYVRSGSPILFMSNRSAELAKYAANTFLAMKISFINDMALLAEKAGADIHDVRRGIISDSRIGSKFLYPGCGYGGSCFPKDVLALVHLGKETETELSIFKAVHEVNERQKKVLFQKIEKHFNKDLKNKTIAVWGLSFKPETDDMREAPSVTLIQQLLENGVKVKAYDPVSKHEAKKIFEDRVELVDDAYEAVKGADALVLVTEWNEFRNPDFELLKKELRAKTIFDGRNLYNVDSVRSHGLNYHCIGKAVAP